VNYNLLISSSIALEFTSMQSLIRFDETGMLAHSRTAVVGPISLVQELAWLDS